MSDEYGESGLTRRKLLIGGGVGVGLLVAWGLWPRQYEPDLLAAKGEHIFGAWLKIGEDGKIVPLDVKKGDRILFGKWSGTEVKIDGVEYLIMKESDIMGVLEGKSASKKAA